MPEHLLLAWLVGSWREDGGHCSAARSILVHLDKADEEIEMAATVAAGERGRGGSD